MSRLELNIRRLIAQRACLERAAALIRDLPGPVLELGLGNGRSYDHLRKILPGREIFVFDREVAAHPDCIPDDDHLCLGDIRDTLPLAARRFAGTVALIHADIGSADPERDRRLVARIAAELPRLLRPGGVVAADRDVGFPGADPIVPPEGADPGLYFLYRLPAAGAVATAQAPHPDRAVDAAK